MVASVFRMKVVWISGKPTSGKSWLGDFLSLHHDYHHVDGDEQFYMQPNSEANLLYNKADDIKALGKESAPEDLWSPYLTNICIQAINSGTSGNYSKIFFSWLSSMTLNVSEGGSE